MVFGKLVVVAPKEFGARKLASFHEVEIIVWIVRLGEGKGGGHSDARRLQYVHM